MSFSEIPSIRSALELLLQHRIVSAVPQDPQHEGSFDLTIRICPDTDRRLDDREDVLSQYDTFCTRMEEDQSLGTPSIESPLDDSTDEGCYDPSDVNEPWWPHIQKAMSSNKMKNNHPTRTDVELLTIFYRSKSGRQRAKDPSKAFTTKGHFSSIFSYLRDFVKDNPPLNQSAPRNTTFSAGRAHRNHCRWDNVNGTSVYSGFTRVSSSKQPSLIVLSFTRASSHPPTYGLEGMFIRGRVAAEAWVEVEDYSDVTISSIPRTRVSSMEAISKTNAEGHVVVSSKSALREIECILDAAADGQDVDLLSVGIDGLSSHVSSLAWVQEKWSRLNIRLIYVVPDKFPAREVFCVARNGIRYGNFSLVDVIEVWQGKRSDPEVQQLLDFHEAVNQGKQETAFNMNLQELTVSRANFRVHPDSDNDSGVPQNSKLVEDEDMWDVDE